MVLRALFLWLIAMVGLPALLVGQCDPVIIGATGYCPDAPYQLLGLNTYYPSTTWSSTDGEFENSASPWAISIFSPGTYCVETVDAQGCNGSACFTVAQGCSGGGDIDNDGYFSGVLASDPLFDPDDLEPCVPDACGAICDFDGDGIANEIDSDIDNDGIPNASDPCDCGFTNTDVYVSDFYFDGCFSPGEEMLFVAELEQPINDPAGLLTEYQWQVSADGTNYVDLENGQNECLVGGSSSDTLLIRCDELNWTHIRIAVNAAACGWEYSEPYIFSNDLVLPIQSTSLCPSSPESCEKVCENSTVTYSVENPEQMPVIWEVNGSVDYTANGNEVTVEWGEAGSGEVKVSILDDKDYLQVDCGQVSQVIDSTNQLGASFIIGNSYAGGIEISENGGLSWSQFYSGEIHVVPSLNVGVYEYQIRDATGNTKSCSVEITTEARYETFANSVGPSSCGEEDGIIFFRGLHNNDFSPIISGSPSHPFFINLINLETGFSRSDTVYLQYQGPGSLVPFTELPAGPYQINYTNLSNGETTTEYITLTCPPDCQQEGQRCIEILKEPKAVFTSVPAAVNNIIDLCKAETVQFTNNSTASSSFIWDFGDGTVSLVKDALHTFYEPGIYEVKLIARNGCYCSDTTSVRVEVSDAEIPEILCLGPVCEGDTATYRSNVVCGNYEWGNSPNGSVISGGGQADDFVTIQWNGGSSGDVSLQVSACTGNICPKTVRQKISIISNQTDIEGQVIVCPNTETEYFIEAVQGADYQWEVPSFGLILEGQGTPKISVRWGDFDGNNASGLIKISYQNCFLGCAGNGELPLQMRPPTLINGPIEICEGSSPSFTHSQVSGYPFVEADWFIYDVHGVEMWASDSPVTGIHPTFDFGAGTYSVRAFPAGESCNGELGLQVEVFALPPPLDTILGEMNICPGQAYNYQVSSNLENATYSWFIRNGIDFYEKTGRSINVKWASSPPYALIVSQEDWNSPGCQSPSFIVYPAPLPGLEISGDASLCRENSAFYETGFYENINYEWSVSPPQAGAITGGQGTAQVEVFWQQAGTATIAVISN
ncbi:MAG TPA: PKD domain-containing protein [Bacteroidetes bacterium]|nr:PKD domain-containing protein [Bacteroidota bacterium]